MSINNISNLRNQIKNGVINKPKPNKTPGTNNQSSFPIKTAIGATAGLGTLGFGASKLLNHHDDKIGEFGSHFGNAFSNLTGIHEDVSGSGGVSISSSSAPMAYTGSQAFPMLKDKSPLDIKWSKGMKKHKRNTI